MVSKVVSSVVTGAQISLWFSIGVIGINPASQVVPCVPEGDGGRNSSNSKLNMSSISTENADNGDGRSKSEISDGVDKLECVSDCFSVVNEEQDVVDPCLISSHNLCNSSALRSMLSVFLQ